MSEGAKKFPGAGAVCPPTYIDASANSISGPQERAKLEWAKDLLAQVIRTIGNDSDAPFASEALQAAVLIEQHDLATFARYRRNLKQRHISMAVLDAGLRRLKPRAQAAARNATAVNPPVPRPSTAAPNVSKARPIIAPATPAAVRPGLGRELKLPEPQPWPAAVDGASLLDELSNTIRSYLVIAVEAVHAVALWALFTYLVDAFETSPRLAITSPQKRCGKTTLLALLAQLTYRPLAAANLTPAVVYRVIEAVRPTLLIDETDTFLKENHELRGILNSGHGRATAFVIRCQGEHNEPRCFSTWAAIALAGIGQLPATLADRSIEIKLQRKTQSEPVQPLSRSSRTALNELGCRSARWSLDHKAQIRSADPELPAQLDDRAADNWRPLIALADAAGGQWPKLARTAAVALGGSRNDDGIAVALLAAIKRLFAQHHTRRLRSRTIVDTLTADPTAKWREANRGRPLSEAQLARLLRPFEIYPTSFGSARGYRLADCQDAFARYLSPDTA